MRYNIAGIHRNETEFAMAARKVHLEWMRIIAIVLVIFNHLPGYQLFLSAQGAEQRVCMFISMLTRINVPLFLMISGAVLLGRSEDFATVFKKRVLRMALVLALFILGLYALHAAYYILYKGEAYDFSLKKYIYEGFLLHLDGTISYWFLIAYISYLCMLPFLQRIAHGMGRQDFIVLTALRALICTLVPMLNLLLPALGQPKLYLSEHLTFPLAVLDAFYYPLVGYWLENAVDVRRLRRPQVLGIGAAGAAGLIAACLCTAWQGASKSAYTQDFVKLFDYAAALAAFILIKRLVLVTLPALGRGKAARFACFLGPLTFGIYLLDPYWKVLLWGPYSRLVSAPLGVMGSSLLWCLISILLGGCAAWALRKVPGIRRLL